MLPSPAPLSLESGKELKDQLGEKSVLIVSGYLESGKELKVSRLFATSIEASMLESGKELKDRLVARVFRSVRAVSGIRKGIESSESEYRMTRRRSLPGIRKGIESMISYP